MTVQTPARGGIVDGMRPLLLLGLLAAATAAVSGAEQVSFERQIKPILSDRCYSCHADKKQKGDLRLDSPSAITKGGKAGAVVVAGRPDKSTLYSRLLLPKDDDDVMPAKGDPLTHEQCELIRQWIADGAAFSDQPAVAAKAPAGTAAPAGAAAVPAPAPLVGLPATTLDILAGTLPPPDAAALKALSDAGGTVRTLSKNNAALSVDLSHAGDALERALPLIERLGQDVLWLDLKGTLVSDAQLRLLPKLKNLQRLHLERTAISDAGLAQVKLCTQLTYLNLYGTKITDAGLRQLSSLSALAHLYVWQSAATPAGIAELRKALPECEVDGAPDLPTPLADGAGQPKKGKGKMAN
jgi:mono/diheme cytochrome c family protein